MNGNFGYIKTNKITNKEYKRTDMGEDDFTSRVSNISECIEITNSVIKEENLVNFDVRKNTVQNIISQIILKEKFTINLNLSNVNVQSEHLERFIIELKPRLKEIGGSLIVTNNNVLSRTFLEQNGL